MADVLGLRVTLARRSITRRGWGRVLEQAGVLCLPQLAQAATNHLVKRVMMQVMEGLDVLGQHQQLANGMEWETVLVMLLAMLLTELTKSLVKQ